MRLVKFYAGLAILVALFTVTWPAAVLARPVRAPPAPRPGPIKHMHPPRLPPPPPPQPPSPQNGMRPLRPPTQSPPAFHH
uniref:Uncharacterized protein n=1 Tax=Arundo donax TaxID=35708 RepID=A0A0A9C859_ARUDO